MISTNRLIPIIHCEAVLFFLSSSIALQWVRGRRLRPGKQIDSLLFQDCLEDGLLCMASNLFVAVTHLSLPINHQSHRGKLTLRICTSPGPVDSSTGGSHPLDTLSVHDLLYV
jgi:hypothetical protein